jgi:hypothetical protein
VTTWWPATDVTVRLSCVEGRAALTQAARSARITRSQHQVLAAGISDLLAQVGSRER